MRSRLIQKNNIVAPSLIEVAGAIRGYLEGSRQVVVASHIDPDGDAIGTQLAFASYLRSLGKTVYLVRDSDLPEKYGFLAGTEAIRHISEYADGLSVDTALVLECPNIERVGLLARHLTGEVKIINIDHHRDNDGFGVVNWVDSRASSVGEMAYKYFAQVGFALDSDTAEQLYTAILTDTGRFRFSSTSPRTLVIASELVAAGADPQRITDEVYFNLRPAVIKLVGKVLNGIEFHNGGTICVLTLTKDNLAASGARESDSDGLVDFTLFSADVVTGALFKEVDSGHTKVSLRSRDSVNVSELAARFGGGGHFNAAGCTVPMSLNNTKDEIIKLLTEAIDDQAR
jgi:phosphoesterase RecJ-like protein